MESVPADLGRRGTFFADKNRWCVLKCAYLVGYIQETTANGSDKQFMHCCGLHRNRVLEFIHSLYFLGVGIFSRCLTIAAGLFEDEVPRD